MSQTRPTGLKPSGHGVVVASLEAQARTGHVPDAAARRDDLASWRVRFHRAYGLQRAERDWRDYAQIAFGIGCLAVLLIAVM
jgi:hypothetical protein